MDIVMVDGPNALAEAAAQRIAEALPAGGVLGVATGSSPSGVYRSLAARVRSGALNLRTSQVFALDEYVGLPVGHPQSYAAVVAREVTGPLGLSSELVAVPDGHADDVSEAAERYEMAIAAAGGVDVQILGIGTNGHIGFNEPGSPFTSRTRLVELAPQTRIANARFFDRLDTVPRWAITQGIATIMAARRIVLVAQGAQKATAIQRIVDGPVSAQWPGSVLQRHPDVAVILDIDAASWLEGVSVARSSVGEGGIGDSSRPAQS